ncbi:MAG: chloride channel protein [Acidimicrobiales bacterium]|nr:chloride channel protein [Acidimicrobiales bacterium]MCB9374039.1 chloride channel protein [Microthrixaceae bacterium]
MNPRNVGSELSKRLLALSALTGAITGVGVAAFEWVTRDQIFERILGLPLPAQALFPLVGLALTAVALATVGRGATAATSDDYIRNFHERGRPLDLKPLPARLLGGLATLGTGGALGFEGPSLYLGASVGTLLDRLRPRRSARGRADSKVLMVAGAAAGVAAIFKAPATGAIFALESPYRDDNARRMLLPALLAAATGYLSAVTLLGTEPLFSVEGTPPFDLRELGGAVVLGLLCGVGARLFAWIIGWAKSMAATQAGWVRVLVAGGVMAALVVVSDLLFDEPLATGSGYRTLEWVTEPGHALPLVAALFTIRLFATTATVGGGGVGGLFVPLVIAGAVLGDAMSVVVDDRTTLFPLIGVAAFLGAGYRTPLAGVVFVAETTGRPGFVVPGLIASVASQLVMGSVSVSKYQIAGRAGHLERRLRLPVTSALDADVLAVPADADLASFHEHHLLARRQLDVPVVDANRYLGMLTVGAVGQVPREEWSERSAGEMADTHWPVGRLTWALEDAVRAMNEHEVETLPIVDDGQFVGVVTMSGLLHLDEILDSGEARPGPGTP